MGDQPSKPGDYVNREEVKVKNGHDGYEIQCKVWKPKGRIRATALFIHGGKFSTGDRNSHSLVSESLAAQTGIAIITADFRDGSATTYASGKSLRDLMAIAEYMKKRFYNEPFGIVGSSSGGFFALAVCNEMELGAIKFCILLCPVAHPHARAVYLNHCIQGTTPLASGKDLYHIRLPPEKAQDILTNQLQFFGTYKEMAMASEEVSENVHKVPTLLILGSADANIPSQVTQRLVDSWASRTIIIGGAGHEIQNAPPSDLGQSYLPDVERFLQNIFKDEHYEPLWKSKNDSDQ